MTSVVFLRLLNPILDDCVLPVVDDQQVAACRQEEAWGAVEGTVYGEVGKELARGGEHLIIRNENSYKESLSLLYLEFNTLTYNKNCRWGRTPAQTTRIVFILSWMNIEVNK